MSTLPRIWLGSFFVALLFLGSFAGVASADGVVSARVQKPDQCISVGADGGTYCPSVPDPLNPKIAITREYFKHDSCTGQRQKIIDVEITAEAGGGVVGTFAAFFFGARLSLKVTDQGWAWSYECTVTDTSLQAVGSGGLMRSVTLVGTARPGEDRNSSNCVYDGILLPSCAVSIPPAGVESGALLFNATAKTWGYPEEVQVCVRAYAENSAQAGIIPPLLNPNRVPQSYGLCKVATIQYPEAELSLPGSGPVGPAGLRGD